MLYVVLGGGLVSALGAEAPAQSRGEELYRQACAACHGRDGKGLSPESPLLANFKAPPPDLTDPLFNSREPGMDWKQVILYGGAPLGLSSQMPAFGDAFTEEEVDALVAYLKSLADTRNYPPGEMNFPRPLQTIKAFPEDEALWISRYQNRKGEGGGFLHTLYYARRWGARAQTEVKLSHLSEGGTSGFREVELGFKWALAYDLQREWLAGGGVEAEFPVNSPGEPLTLMPYLSLAKGLSERFSLQTTLRSHLPTEGTRQGDLQFSGAVHWMTTPWPRGVFPGLEATWTLPFGPGASWESTLLPQALVTLSRAGHVALAAGVEIPLTDLDYRYRLRWFLLWDVADGPFWKGW